METTTGPVSEQESRRNLYRFGEGRGVLLDVAALTEPELDTLYASTQEDGRRIDSELLAIENEMLFRAHGNAALQGTLDFDSQESVCPPSEGTQ